MSSRRSLFRGLAFAALSLAQPLAAQESEPVAIKAVKAQAFLERSGRFSDDLAAARKPLKNLARPTSPLGEPAYAMLVTMTFSGPKNGTSSTAIARDMAQVTVKQKAAGGERTLLFRAVGGFSFGADGLAHRAFMLDDATCDPLAIEVRIARSRINETIDLACDPIETPAASGEKSKGGARRR